MHTVAVSLLSQSLRKHVDTHGAVLMKRCLIRTEIPIIQIWRFHDRLIVIIEIVYSERPFDIETGSKVRVISWLSKASAYDCRPCSGIDEISDVGYNLRREIGAIVCCSLFCCEYIIISWLLVQCNYHIFRGSFPCSGAPSQSINQKMEITPGGRLNKKDGLTRYGNSHVKDKTS